MFASGCADEGDQGEVDFVQNPDSRLIKVQPVGSAAFGPLNPHSAVLSDAAVAFGRPASVDRLGELCMQRWPAIGLTIQFRASAGDDQCGGKARIERIRVAGGTAVEANWRTAEGIRPLQRLSGVRRIYPEAGMVRSGRLVLVKPPGGEGEPVLVARLVDGRVGAMEFPIDAASG